MNEVPESFIRVSAEDLLEFAGNVLLEIGVPPDQANMLSDALVAGDLRGVFSHGTQQLGSYIPLLTEGKLNTSPKPAVVSESESSITVDGDGGLGYFAGFLAIEMAIEKARSSGMAVATTSNHGHFGSAGHYTRKAVQADCFGLAVSSHYREFNPETSILSASGASPISMGVPAAHAPPLIIDMASGGDRAAEFFEEIPATYFKMLGFGLMSHALGGILSGMVAREAAGPRKWEGVNQGAFFMVVDIGRLTDVESYKCQMDEFINSLRAMTPPPGYDHAATPGGLEFERETTWRTAGIPIGEGHMAILEKVADGLGCALPWAR